MALKTHKQIKFNHYHGDQAYMFFFIDQETQLALKHLYMFYKNLEIIMSEEFVLYAYRSDHPMNMRHMVKDDGKWILTHSAKKLDDLNLIRLKLLCKEYSLN